MSFFIARHLQFFEFPHIGSVLEQNIHVLPPSKGEVGGRTSSGCSEAAGSRSLRCPVQTSRPDWSAGHACAISCRSRIQTGATAPRRWQACKESSQILIITNE